MESHTAPTLWQRLRNVFGPLVGCVILDGLDLPTFGHFGILVGGAVGAIATWLICSAENLSAKSTWILTALGALYCAFPFTEVLPLATILVATVRFFDRPTLPQETEDDARVKHLQDSESKGQMVNSTLSQYRATSNFKYQISPHRRAFTAPTTPPEPTAAKA